MQSFYSALLVMVKWPLSTPKAYVVVLGFQNHSLTCDMLQESA